MEYLKIPKVTVLMPVYNGQKYLKEAIESILNQTFEDFEFLIINDGSTDKSEDIIEEYKKKDSRIIYKKNEKNLGLIKTLNSGLAVACGEYIIRMDSDDVSELNRIEKQVQFLDKYSDIGVLGSWFDFINDSLEVKWPTDNEDIKVQLFHRTAIGHPTVALRRSVLLDNNITYDINFPHAEDYNLWIDLLNITKFTNYPEILFHYRAHQNQISIVYRDKQNETVDKVRLKALNYLVDNFTKKEADLHLALLNNQLAEVDFSEAKKWLNALSDANNQKKVFNKDKFDIFVKNILNKLKEPLVSIIIPAYNSAEFISETLDCLINQNYTKWEAIIVDDGSTDNTAEIVQEYIKKDNRFRYVRQENLKTSVARNVGLRMSRGEYIQFLDSDDFISKNKISDEILIFNQDPDTEIVYSDYICFANEDRKKEWTYSRVVLKKNNPLLDFAKNWEKDLSIPIHCFLYKKYCLDSVDGFDESLTINNEDWDLHLRLAAKKYNFRHHKCQGSFYRVCLTRNSRARSGRLTIRGKRAMLGKFIFNYDLPIKIKILFALRYYEDLYLIRKINAVVLEFKNLRIILSIKRLIHLLLNPKIFLKVAKDKYYKFFITGPKRVFQELKEKFKAAGLSDSEFWKRHPVGAVGRCIPVRFKRKINSLFGKKIFNLKYYRRRDS
jgi:glycosyltransferase involved in cell wall biosynthesis